MNADIIPILKENKSFCILPFIHLHVNEKNNIKLCCIADVKETEILGQYTQDFDFNTNTRFQEIRRAMLAGERVSMCASCYEYEDQGAKSSRIWDTQEWLQKLNITSIEEVPTELMYYDIRNDNLCNLSCRMCNPHFSSQLQKEYATIPGWKFKEAPMSFGLNDVVNLDTVKKIYVAGGEPTLMPQFKKFLKRAIDAGRTDIQIRMNTNATNVNKEFRDLLSQFTQVEAIVSIDGFDQVNKYIRWPSDWPTWVENAHALLKITPNMSFNITVSIWNISNLSKLIEFISAEFPKVTPLLNRVYGQPGWLFTTFPNKELAIEDLKKLRKYYKYDLTFRQKVEFYINEMQNSTVDLVALQEFFKYNDTLDKSRGIHLGDYIPELEACRALITKPT
jgi:MoaA/NifB/PqqE/SkfB family radical SAM enzyme